MEDLNAIIKGSIELPRDVRFYGSITGTLTVAPGRRFELFGTVGRDLVVEKDATAVVHGAVRGTLVNKGGKVVIDGGSVARIDDHDPAHPTPAAAPAPSSRGSS